MSKHNKFSCKTNSILALSNVLKLKLGFYINILYGNVSNAIFAVIFFDKFIIDLRFSRKLHVANAQFASRSAVWWRTHTWRPCHVKKQPVKTAIKSAATSLPIGVSLYRGRDRSVRVIQFFALEKWTNKRFRRHLHLHSGNGRVATTMCDDILCVTLSIHRTRYNRSWRKS